MERSGSLKQSLKQHLEATKVCLIETYIYHKDIYARFIFIVQLHVNYI